MHIPLTALLIPLGAALSLAATAQDRPSLERLEASACVAAEARGDSYRPVFCEPRCGCADVAADLPPESGPLDATCAQNTEGVVEIRSRIVEVGLVGICVGACELGGNPCLLDTDCHPLGQIECKFDAGVCADVACELDSQCDQARGYTCQPFTYGSPDPPIKRCQASPGSCTFSDQCEDAEFAFFAMSFEFAPAGETASLSCASAIFNGGASATSTTFQGETSSTDVAACIAEVEALLGAGTCVICGDGNLDPGEACDDGNLDSGDGCSATCTGE